MFFAALVISPIAAANQLIRRTDSQASCRLKKTLAQGSMNCVTQSGKTGGPINNRPNGMTAY